MNKIDSATTNKVNSVSWIRDSVKIPTDNSSISYGRISIGNIAFPDGDKKYKYNPKEDITPYEVSRLLLLFYYASSNRDYYGLDHYSYIKEHKLERHFELVV